MRPDPLTGLWTSLYGRGLRTKRHCYLPGPFRGVVNYQAAKLSSEIILTESILDALSFHQAGIQNAVPIYGTNGFTAEHLDLLKRESVQSVVVALDNDESGQRAAKSIKEKITSAGISVRSLAFPDGIKDANELLVSTNGDAGDVFRGAGSHDFAAAIAAFRAKVDDPVCGFNHFQIVLDDHHGIAMLDQFMQHFQQFGDIVKM